MRPSSGICEAASRRRIVEEPAGVASPGPTNMALTTYPLRCTVFNELGRSLPSLFDAEFSALPGEVQTSLLAKARLLETFGPQLGRPHVDTLKGSKHGNMKELRFEAADGVWRAAFAFDPERRALVLVAGDKSGGSEKRFYRSLIADARFDGYLAKQEKDA